MNTADSKQASILAAIRKSGEELKALANIWAANLRDEKNFGDGSEDAKTNPLLRAALSSGLTAFAFALADIGEVMQVALGFEAHHLSYRQPESKVTFNNEFYVIPADMTVMEEMQLRLTYEGLPKEAPPVMTIKAAGVPLQLYDEMAKRGEKLYGVEDQTLQKTIRDLTNPLSEADLAKPENLIPHCYMAAMGQCKARLSPMPRYEQWLLSEERLTVLLHLLPVETLPVIVSLDLDRALLVKQILAIQKNLHFH